MAVESLILASPGPATLTCNVTGAGHTRREWWSVSLGSALSVKSWGPGSDSGDRALRDVLKDVPQGVSVWYDEAHRLKAGRPVSRSTVGDRLERIGAESGHLRL